MKKTIFFIAVAVLCLFFRVNGQVGGGSAVSRRALLIGDRVPDLVFNNVMNYRGQVLRLSDFKRKAVLLDFWATWCGSCIAHLPEVMALQRKYGEGLQVIAVNGSMRDSREKVEAFVLKQEGTARAFVTPVIYQDTVLRDLFPREAIPHYVWIGLDGRVKAITGASAVKEENVKRLVAGLSLNLPVKGGKDD
ncbi:TlpA family protein disulfide reductase [Pedobacter sp. G11]|uniref:TlpA family protein disulfide reductase n=1 Tax=Pedobacter sp. G11 TaxID=2482728 RepID=UPI000F5EBC23|nr:TlpA disulfide reductase family protein [Pedobacter sp. G11]AZI26682.1 TlpA family protein disulfide reductase [Pedobacter sp. G11]